MTHHEEVVMIKDKYQLIKLLGEGSAGKTYEAKEIATQRRVAIKIMTLRQVKDWKAVELFEREANVLADLQHPAIPKYIDYFYQDTPDDRNFYLVRELISGNSLFDLVQQRWKPDEDEVQEIAKQILSILQYLHQQKPPIIHRDIKPQNLIRDESGKIFLVDFGSVTEAYRQTLIGNSTFVGTLGYMPLEQLRGDVSLSTDLYSLGATLLFLLTKQNPDSLPQKRMRLIFQDLINVSDRFSNWLNKILEPIAEDRFQSATEALRELNSKNEFPQPTGSKIILKKDNNTLEATIPLSGFNGDRFNKNNIYSVILYLVSNVMICFILLVSIGDVFVTIRQGHANLWGLVFAIMMLPFWAISFSMLLGLIWQNFGQIYIIINRDYFKISKRFWGLGISNRGTTSTIKKVEGESNDYEVRGYNLTYCTIKGEKEVHFGVGITQAERDWLTVEIKDFVEKIQAQ